MRVEAEKSNHVRFSSFARQGRNQRRLLKHRLVQSLAGCLASHAPEFVIATSSPGSTDAVLSCAGSSESGITLALGLSSLEEALGDMLENPLLPVSALYRDQSKCVGPTSTQRQRDIFPLPLIHQWDEDVTPVGSPLCFLYANACVSALNHLRLDFRNERWRPPTTRSPTVAQQRVLKHIMNRVAKMLERLSNHASVLDSWRTSLDDWAKRQQCEYDALVAEKVEIPLKAGTCDPASVLPAEAIDLLGDVDQVFETREMDLTLPAMHSSEYLQYVLVVVRELQSEKARLRHHIKGIGAVFARSKASGSQRLLWNGHTVSELAKQPPKPRRLANPSMFVDICVPAGTQLYYSKRDARCYFDSLKAPSALTQFFGRPAILVSDLLAHSDFTLDALENFVDDATERLSCSDFLHPVSTCWPQGFSWSSYVAQENTLAVCAKAGVLESVILSLDHPMPSDQSELVAVCTDDVICMHTDRTAASIRVARLDEEMQAAGIIKNATKDVDQELFVTGLGCDLSNSPPKSEPSAIKVASCISAILHLTCRRYASPAIVNSILGVMQWFCLQQRPIYSCFDKVYEFVRQAPFETNMYVPTAVINEMVVAMLLLPLTTACFERQWLPMLTSCDASGSFGFGVSVADCTVEQASSTGRLADRRGVFVRLFADEDNPREAEKPRIGIEHRIPVRDSLFRHVIRSKAKWKAHSSVLEAHALALAVRWHGRRPQSHSHRICILADAQAVIAAAVKGRTSARAIRASLRTIAATSLATDMLLRICYIPSETNPSDLPSRGGRRARGTGMRSRTRTKHSRRGTRTERRLLELAASLERLRECGMIDDFSNSSESSCSSGDIYQFF